MIIVYAVATDGDKHARHVSLDNVMTLCGKSAGKAETLAIPVNCGTCRTELGRINRARISGGK